MPVTDPTAETTPPAASTPQLPRIDRKSLNVPNCITLARLVLAVVLFAMISFSSAWVAAAVMFVIAAATDALDGYIARKYGLVTTLGRILDPFADKIIICGAFLFWWRNRNRASTHGWR